MKIAIFSYPRTGSTHLVISLAKKWSLKYPNFGQTTMKYEVMTQAPTATKQAVTNFISSATQGFIVKFMSHNFYDFPYTAVDWSVFDQIYATYRHDNARGCASLYLASTMHCWQRRSGQLDITVQPFTVTDTAIEVYANQINKFNEQISYIKTKNTNVKMISYCDIISDQGLAQFNDVTEPLNLDYPSICLNYTEIGNKLSKLIK